MCKDATRLTTIVADPVAYNAIALIGKNARDRYLGCPASSQRRLAMQGLAACCYNPSHRQWRENLDAPLTTRGLSDIIVPFADRRSVALLVAALTVRDSSRRAMSTKSSAETVGM